MSIQILGIEADLYKIDEYNYKVQMPLIKK